MKICNECGTPLGEEELFCSGCGAKLGGAEDGRQRAEIRSQKSEIREERSEDGGRKTEVASTTNNQQLATSPIVNHQSSIVNFSASECEDFTVFYNSARILMEDASLPFEFRILPKSDDLDHLKITVSNQQGMKFSGLCRRSLKPGKERKLSVDVRVPAGQRGMLSFDVSVEYRKEGKACRYECPWRSEVVPREVQSIQNLVIDIKQTQGHAGDIGGVNMSGIEKLAESGKWSAILRELAKIPPSWTELNLEECGEFSPVCDAFNCQGILADPSPKACCERLTLETGGQKIHLISGDQIQLGRNRDSDLTTRIFDEAGNMPREENLYISKSHCGFVKSGSSVKIQDGNLATGEAKGKTWLNGSVLNGSMELPTETDFQPSFGKPGAMGRILSFKGRLLLTRNEDGSAEPSGILLQRNDHVPESYLIVYDRMAMKILGPDWDGWCVARHKNGFCFGRDGTCRWLTPGTREFADSRLLEVKNFAQYGL